MSHVVVGAGAVGVGIATALLAAGERVVFVAREARARGLRERGCARTGLFGDVRFGPERFEVVDAPAAVSGPVTGILVSTKAFATAEVAAALAAAPRLAESRAPIVSLQNGLGNAEALAARLPAARVFNATLLVGFRDTGPGRVDVTVCAKPVQLGSLFGADPNALAPLAAALARGGIPAEVCADIGRELWAKTLYNCALNPLGAILRVPYGALAERATTRRLMDRVIDEVFAVMQATGERTDWQGADAYRRHFYEVLLPPTASHESSMLQDVRAGRPTEIDALCGEVARRGERAGVATPVNRALHQLVRAIEGPGEIR